MNDLLGSRKKYSDACENLITAYEEDLRTIDKSIEEKKKELTQEKIGKQDFIEEKESK